MSDGDHAVLAGRRALIVGDDELSTGIGERLVRAGAEVRVMANAGAIAESAALDVLIVNPLGPAQAASLDVADAQSIDTALAWVASTARHMQLCFPKLRERGGRIILIGHRYGESVNEGLAAYNAAAWGLVGLTRAAAVDWGRYQITTNLLLPLAATSEFLAAQAQRPKIVDLMVSQIPLRRVGHPANDVGGAVVFLASDAARFINGEVIHADGGQHIAGPVVSPIRFTTALHHQS